MNNNENKSVKLKYTIETEKFSVNGVSRGRITIENDLTCYPRYKDLFNAKELIESFNQDIKLAKNGLRFVTIELLDIENSMYRLEIKTINSFRLISSYKGFESDYISLANNCFNNFTENKKGLKDIQRVIQDFAIQGNRYFVENYLSIQA